MENIADKDNLVLFRTSQGAEVRATLVRLGRFAAAVEIYDVNTVLQTSEVLSDFRLFLNDRPIYSGSAVVSKLMNVGTVFVAEVQLDDLGFDTEFLSDLGQAARLDQRFDEFVRQWQQAYKVLPEFKVAVADIQTFLIDLRRWMEQVELGIRSSPGLDRTELERAAVDKLSPRVIPVLDELFEKYEVITARLDADQTPVHRSYVQRHLHPLVLCAPFAYRTYAKPLGYAGDYEMVNMIARNGHEGSSLFAKLFNVWLLQQGSAAAHRNRIEYLTQRLVDETATAARAGRVARIFNLGCGPAWEIRHFLAQTQLSNHAQFTLVDFNEETIQHVSQALQQEKQRSQRTATFEFIRKSVQQVLKETARVEALSATKKYDLVYCAGLFDYLPDRICKRLMNVFYRSLAPGGLVVATNVAPFNPNRGSLELILDWLLIYRDAPAMNLLRPDDAPADDVRLRGDATGVNVFIEARNANGS
jgi:extracellular factor (EF) 3-hydroxypalmitic acid methyl ester biosynthesis protein